MCYIVSNDVKKLISAGVQKMKELSIAFIGAGKMATAIAAGLAKNTTGLKVRAYDVSPAAAESFTAATGFTCCSSMAETLADAEIVLLAVKPQYAAEALKEAVEGGIGN